MLKKLRNVGIYIIAVAILLIIFKDAPILILLQCLFVVVVPLAFIFSALRLLYKDQNPVDPPKVELTEADHFRRLETIEQIYKLAPLAFERFVGSLFSRMGYQVQTTAITGDGGVDLVLTKNGELSIAQCKRFSRSVGQPVLRDLYGTMFDKKARRAYLVTTGTFTPAAEAFSANKSLILVDGQSILDWIKNLPDNPTPSE